MDKKPIPEMSLADLNDLYREGEECDKRMFAEMRTNLQLTAGEHYVREGSKFWNRIRDNKQLTTEQRLKLTKNHIQRVTKIYRNSIESYAPGIEIVAAREAELKDQKTAQLNQSYWDYVKASEEMESKVSMWIKNFIEIGEVCVKVFWDMNGGQIVGYEAEMIPDPVDPNGSMIPQLDETGQPVQSETPVYGGRVRYETFEGYNVRRDRSARTMSESPFLILSKLIPKKQLKAFVKNEDDIRKMDNAPTQEYAVYDNNTGTYRIAKDQVLVKEVYWRPAPNIQKGYYFIHTDAVMVDHGELPYGIWPIIHEGFDEQTGNPRFHSVIRHCRPAQIEINRCASKIAEHQITMGDTKAWVPSGTKISQGAFLPGVRVNTYSGVAPTFTEGQVGSQYMEYLDKQVAELYILANLDEIVQEVADSADLYTNLLRSYRFRRKFSIYGQKFERFLKRIVETTLKLAKHCISEQELIPAVGQSEYINIPEFKASEDIHYRLRLQPRSEDVESQFGKQITLNHILQYVGPSLGKEDLGQMIRLSPFLNDEKMFQKLTQKYDNMTNDILAMDRGTFRPPRRYDDHDYIIDALQTRMSKGDYEQLPSVVQQLYEKKLQIHEQLKANALIEIQRAQAGFIPSGGYMVKCDFYMGDPENPTKVKRVALPSESVNWLIQSLQKQGSAIDEFSHEPQGVLQDVGAMVQRGGQGQQPGGQPGPGGSNISGYQPPQAAPSPAQSHVPLGGMHV